MSSASHALELLREKERDLVRMHAVSRAQLETISTELHSKRALVDAICVQVSQTKGKEREEAESALRTHLDRCMVLSKEEDEARARATTHLATLEDVRTAVSVASQKLQRILREIEGEKAEEEDEEEEEEESLVSAHNALLARVYRPMTKEERELHASFAMGRDTHKIHEISYAQYKEIYQRMYMIRHDTTRGGQCPAPKYNEIMIKRKMDLSRKTLKVALHYSHKSRYADEDEMRRCIVCACPFEEFWEYVPTCPLHIAHAACIISVDNAFHTSSCYRNMCPGVWTIGSTKCHRFIDSY